jgi:hypothetical protein
VEENFMERIDRVAVIASGIAVGGGHGTEEGRQKIVEESIDIENRIVTAVRRHNDATQQSTPQTQAKATAMGLDRTTTAATPSKKEKATAATAKGDEAA